MVSAGYDEATQTLELEFATGRIYQYRGVPRGTYEWLLRAKSKGCFVSRMINERYSYVEVSDPPVGAPQDLEQALRDSLRARDPHRT